MRARMFVSWAVVSGGIVLAISSSAAWSQSNQAPDASQFAGCPTVLPAEEGERSIVVPQLAEIVEPPAQEVPHVASLPQTPQHEGAMSLLKAKLAERDQLQREITALRESTKTPEQILVRVKMVEVNLTHMRRLGLDLEFAQGGFQTVESDKSIQEVCANLQTRNVGKILAEPSLVVVSGRPAAFHVGGDVPFPRPDMPAGFETKPVGTQLDVLANSLGENRVRLEIRPRVSGVSGQMLVGGQQIPTLSVRQVDTAVETVFGKTFVISGFVQNRAVASKDAAGNLHDTVEEIALVVLVSPEIVR